MQEVGICLLYMRAQVGGNKWCVSETGWTQSNQTSEINCQQMKSRPPESLVAGAWTEREKMFHGGSFLKLADDNMDIQNPEAQNRELSGF